MGRVKRILIWDPHPDVAQLFARAVALFGHVPTEDAGVAVDAVVVDIDYVEGRALAHTRHAEGLPVICVTIHDDVPADLGLPCVLVKPFKLRDLRAALACAFDARRPGLPAVGAGSA